MSSHHLFGTFAAAAVVGMTALAGTTSGVSSSPPPPPHRQTATGPTSPPHGSDAPRPACVGVTNCHVVANVDVGGDGRADQVGWRQLSDAAAQIRVHTATGALMTATVDVRLWFGGGAWGGATRIDGQPGAELLAGSDQGAHTPMYTMLTVRNGRLVVEKSPSPLSSLWQIDAAYGDYLGWWRHVTHDGRVTMTQKLAIRTRDTGHFTGPDVTYEWSGARWVRFSSAATTYPTVRQASLIGGFHVAGLEVFPGIG